MDLISRKAAIEALGEEPLRWNNTITEGQEWNDWKYHINAIKSVPTVPAVPLEPLARWITENLDPRCDCDYCLHEDTDFEDRECCNCPRMSEEQVKEKLKKWMEEPQCTSTDTEP